MKNMVECKNCQTSFDYSPGFAGNARQLCVECKLAEDTAAIEKEKELTILEDNRYCKPDYDSPYDPVDILVNGAMPNLSNSVEQFLCARDMGLFVRSNGFMECEKNVVKLFGILNSSSRVIFMKQLDLHQTEHIATRPEFKTEVERLMKMVSG